MTSLRVTFSGNIVQKKKIDEGTSQAINNCKQATAYTVIHPRECYEITKFSFDHIIIYFFYNKNNISTDAELMYAISSNE